MIRRLIDFSLDNRFLILVLWLVAIVVGLAALKSLPMDAVPDVTNVQVQILTDSPGLAPEEIEKFITFPVETAMGGVPHVERVRSISIFGLSSVTVDFKEGTDLYWARQQVAEHLNEVRDEIPADLGKPSLAPISSALGEIYKFEVRGKGYSPMQLRTLLDWSINPQLRLVPGVAEVNAMGGQLKTYQITLDPARLNAYHLPVEDIFQAVQENNHNTGGGYIAYSGEQYLVRGEGLIQTLQDLANILVSYTPQGIPIYVKDLGKVEFAPMIRQGAVTRDGRGETVIGTVLMLMGANTRTVVEGVKQKIEMIQKSLPPGVVIDPFYDRSTLIDRTIQTVVHNLLAGGIIVLIILFLLLGDWRAGLLVSVAIPLSLLIAFLGMRLAGLSANLMSLGALDFGLIVDGSVVMIENILRVLHEEKGLTSASRPKVIRRAAHQVGRPIVFAVSIITIVYLPILSLQGIEGKMFRPMALTVVFALIGSLAIALTLMPVLASLFIRRAPHREAPLFRLAKALYSPVLGWVVRHTWITVLAAFSIFAASLALIPYLGAVFMPKLDEGSIAIEIRHLPSVSLQQVLALSTQVERVLRKNFPEVQTVVDTVGRAEIATDPNTLSTTDTYIGLKPKETWRFPTKQALVEAMDKTLKKSIPGSTFSFNQPIEERVDDLVTGVRSDVAVKIFGDDLDRLKEKGNEVMRVLKTIPGTADVSVEQVTGLPIVQIHLIRQALARYGIPEKNVLDIIETIGGKRLGEVLKGRQRFFLQVRFPLNTRQSVAALHQLKVAAPAGAEQTKRWIPLDQVATITVQEGPSQISHENLSRRLAISADVRGRDIASFVSEARQKINQKISLPFGWYMTWGGQFENLQKALQRLTLLVPLGLLLIFVLLYTTFSSTAMAFLIFLNVPLAVTGGLIALFLRHYPFSISAGVGFIALFGVAVLDGVVLISYILPKQEEGLSPKEAAIEGAKIRLRPVLMTALVASLGFLPMALSTNAGAEVQRPLATVVIGGLVTSTLLTLLVLPTLYRWFSRS